MSSEYDFVIVGGGPSGCALARRLCQSASQPSVLLLEAGADHTDIKLRIDGQRWTTFQNEHMNWGYKTTPQPECADREIDYSRGKGLSGSSAINFGVYTIGAKDDYEEWAKVVGDEFFGWEEMQRRFKSLETFDRTLPAGVDQKYANPEEGVHGSDGPLKVGYAKEWERDLLPLLGDLEAAGLPLNPDHNSGNPLGMSVMISSMSGGLRTTAKELITPQPKNLTILIGSPVQKVLFKDMKAVGVQSEDKSYYATKEVILCAGSLDTPKILMHSGLGNPSELQAFNIPVVSSIPAVGKGLRDHFFTPIVHSAPEGSTDRPGFYANPEAMAAALTKWQTDKTGDWSKFACEHAIGFFKLKELAGTEEYKALPQKARELLERETLPHYELLTHFPIHYFLPDFPVGQDSLSLLVFLTQSQTRGEVTLQSADPNAPLLFNPRVLEHPVDRKMAIQALREAMELTRSESYSKNTIAQMVGPASDSDEDLLEHWRQTAGSSWHMTGTAKMGKSGDADAVVDANFAVQRGIKGLRIADMSVVPVLSSVHVQAVAYVTGLTCGERLVEEYGLDNLKSNL